MYCQFEYGWKGPSIASIFVSGSAHRDPRSLALKAAVLRVTPARTVSTQRFGRSHLNQGEAGQTDPAQPEDFPQGNSAPLRRVGAQR